MNTEPFLSVTIVTQNNATLLSQCLDTLSRVDEIVIVDAESQDETVDIIKRYNNVRFFSRPWAGYVGQKQYALDQAKGTWVLSLDSDERITQDGIDYLINKLRANGDGIQGYYLSRRAFYLGRWINHGWFPEKKLRLFQRTAAKVAGKSIHDRFEVTGKLADLDVEIEHYTYQNIAHHLEKINRYTSAMALDDLHEGKTTTWLSMLYAASKRFVQLYFLRRGFMDGFPGLVVAIMAFYYVSLRHMKLWELQRRLSKPNNEQ